MPELLDGIDGSIKDEKASNVGPAGIDIAYPRLGNGILTRMATLGTPLSFSDVLRLRPVRRLWIAQIVSVFGDFLAVFAIIAVVTFKLHGTATQVAMVLVSFMAPLAIVSPLAGVFVDRWHLKWTLIASDLIRGVLVLALVFVHDLYLIYIILFSNERGLSLLCSGAIGGGAHAGPDGGAPGSERIDVAGAAGSLIVAPSVAGELVQLVGANSCFLYDSFSFFFSAALVMTLTIDRQALRTEPSAVLDSMRHGFGFIFKHSTISFVILSMTAGMFAMRCFGALLSIYVRDVLHSTSAVFGVLNSLIGIGMIIGTQLLTRFARHIPQQNLVVYGLGGMGIAVLTTAAFGTMGSTAAGMLGLGLCASAIFITATSDELPDVAGGGVAGDLDVRGWPGGGKGWDSEPLLSEALRCWSGIGVVGYFKLPRAEKAESAKTG
jgi:DHA3 family macrolide efflux protein-like MFS transporter